MSAVLKNQNKSVERKCSSKWLFVPNPTNEGKPITQENSRIFFRFQCPYKLKTGPARHMLLMMVFGFMSLGTTLYWTKDWTNSALKDSEGESTTISNHRMELRGGTLAGRRWEMLVFLQNGTSFRLPLVLLLLTKVPLYGARYGGGWNTPINQKSCSAKREQANQWILLTPIPLNLHRSSRSCCWLKE